MAVECIRHHCTSLEFAAAVKIYNKHLLRHPSEKSRLGSAEGCKKKMTSHLNLQLHGVTVNWAKMVTPGTVAKTRQGPE